MREIVLDTETTGLDPFSGHRLVEIGCVELLNHMPTGNTYHQYINPRRDMPQEAFDVHGLGIDFLSKYPEFDKIADAFLDFIGDAKLVIHNASFDMKFLNAELEWADKTKIPLDQATDTLDMARRKFPGAQNSLDALCRRFGVDNSAREKHGALLDSEILAEVYLELIGGRQPTLIDASAPQQKPTQTLTQSAEIKVKPRATKLPSLLSEEERAAHSEFVKTLGDKPLWT